MALVLLLCCQATQHRKKEATELALEHFDQFYSPVYGKLWPSIRISLLSPQKYCALVNNFHASPDAVTEELQSRGAYNFLTGANPLKHVYRQTPNGDETKETLLQRNESNRLMDSTNTRDVDSADPEIEAAKERASDSPENMEDNNIGRLPEEPMTRLNQDLYSSFVPAQKVYSDKQLLKDQEVSQNIYEPLNIEVPVIEDSMIRIPKHLKVFIHRLGDVSDFPAPKKDKSGLLGKYK